MSKVRLQNDAQSYDKIVRVAHHLIYTMSAGFNGNFGMYIIFQDSKDPFWRLRGHGHIKPKIIAVTSHLYIALMKC